MGVKDELITFNFTKKKFLPCNTMVFFGRIRISGEALTGEPTMASLSPWQKVIRGRKELEVATGCKLSNGAEGGKTGTMRGGNENTSKGHKGAEKQ